MEILGLKITTHYKSDAKGIWFQLPTGSVFTCYYDKLQGLVAGFYKDVNDTGKGCDLALSVTENGLTLQVKQADGTLKNRNILQC
jgi:hypothetical protein